VKDKAYWKEQDRAVRTAALPQSTFRKKANEYMNLIKETANAFSKIGGEIVIIGGNAAVQSTNFFWAMGSGAREFIKDYEALSLSLYNHFCGQMAAAYLRLNASKVKLSLDERLQQIEGLEESSIPIQQTLTDAQRVASVNRERQKQVKIVLQNLPSDSTLRMYNESGSLTPNFWDTHTITNWPQSLPTFLEKRLTSWTTSLCDSFLLAYDHMGSTWKVLQSADAHGMKDVSRLCPTRYLTLYLLFWLNAHHV